MLKTMFRIKPGSTKKNLPNPLSCKIIEPFSPMVLSASSDQTYAPIILQSDFAKEK
jgi:hypothetical protein